MRYFNQWSLSSATLPPLFKIFGNPLSISATLPPMSPSLPSANNSKKLKEFHVSLWLLPLCHHLKRFYFFHISFSAFCHSAANSKIHMYIDMYATVSSSCCCHPLSAMIFSWSHSQFCHRIAFAATAAPSTPLVQRPIKFENWWRWTNFFENYIRNILI